MIFLNLIRRKKSRIDKRQKYPGRAMLLLCQFHVNKFPTEILWMKNDILCIEIWVEFTAKQLLVKKRIRNHKKILAFFLFSSSLEFATVTAMQLSLTKDSCFCSIKWFRNPQGLMIQIIYETHERFCFLLPKRQSNRRIGTWKCYCGMQCSLLGVKYKHKIWSTRNKGKVQKSHRINSVCSPRIEWKTVL